MDIYEDLDEQIDFDIECKKLQQENTSLNENIAKLEVEITRLNNELINEKNVQKVLENNMSSLFQIARIEVDQKQKLNADLRKQLEELQLSRIGNHSSFNKNKSSERSIKHQQSNKIGTNKEDGISSYSSDRRNTSSGRRNTHRKHSPNRRSKSPSQKSENDYKLNNYDNSRYTERNEMVYDRYISSSNSKRSRMDDNRLPISKRSKIEYANDKFDKNTIKNSDNFNGHSKDHGKKMLRRTMNDDNIICIDLVND